MVYDTGYDKIPHRCGAVLEFCITDKKEVLYFCSLCRLVLGVEKDGITYMKPEVVGNKKQKEYDDKTIEDMK